MYHRGTEACDGGRTSTHEQHFGWSLLTNHRSVQLQLGAHVALLRRRRRTDGATLLTSLHLLIRQAIFSSLTGTNSVNSIQESRNDHVHTPRMQSDMKATASYNRDDTRRQGAGSKQLRDKQLHVEQADTNLCGPACAKCLLVGTSLGLLAGLLDVNVACTGGDMSFSLWLVDTQHVSTSMHARRQVHGCLVESNPATRCAGL